MNIVSLLGSSNRGTIVGPTGDHLTQKKQQADGRGGASREPLKAEH